MFEERMEGHLEDVQENEEPDEMSFPRDKFPFEIHASQGQGGYKVASAPTLKAAIAYTDLHKDDASWGIKLPDGTWYKWPVEDQMVVRPDYLRLDPDVAAMNIEPFRANEILRRLNRVSGLEASVAWMESVMEEQIDFDPDL